MDMDPGGAAPGCSLVSVPAPDGGADGGFMAGMGRVTAGGGLSAIPGTSIRVRSIPTPLVRRLPARTIITAPRGIAGRTTLRVTRAAPTATLSGLNIGISAR